MHALTSLLLTIAAPAQNGGQAVVPTVTKEPDGTSTLAMETVLDASMAEVWQVIATPEGWRRWAAPVARIVPDAEDILETSYALDSKPGDATTIRQQFVAWIPGRMLAFRTVKAPDGFPNFDSYRKVITVIELSPGSAGKTRIVLTATNYPDTEAGRQLLAFFREGNRETLEKLRDVLAKR